MFPQEPAIDNRHIADVYSPLEFFNDLIWHFEIILLFCQ
jgi:hypothetical protein